MLNQIRCVEIEIHSFCNRQCEWCPNVKIKRNTLTLLPEHIYLKVLNELKDNNFNGVISYSRYNEPMADIDLLKLRINQARSIMPHIKLVSNTNGDFLHKNCLEGLLIDDLSVMDYDCIGEKACIHRLKELDTDITKVNYPYIHAKYKDINILYFIDWSKNALIVDRGGFFAYKENDINTNNTTACTFINGFSLKQLKWARKPRKRPCYEPNYFIGIDYTGDITPCCQIRGDNVYHQQYILGNVKNNKLIDILSSKKTVGFRTKLMSSEFSQFPKPCKWCQKDSGRYTRMNSGIEF